jgi:glycerol-3-phosphate acyltransferase PlsY
MIVFCLKLLVAYLLGSLSGSLLLGRLRGVDIRNQGSGNAGGTNAFRTQGWRFALVVALIDVLKGVVAACLGYFWITDVTMSSQGQALACGMAAVLGHVWPVFFGFRGGKGAATLIGAVGFAAPVLIAPLLGVWLLLLTATGYVGFSTVCAGISLPLFACWLRPHDESLLAFGIASALLLIFTHRANLARLRAGTEHRFERVRVWARWLDAR